jgi:histidyl-tRNA synthetase
VLIGKNARAGAGLGMESGVSADAEVMEFMRKSCKGLRVKRFRMQYNDKSAGIKRGVSGAQHLQILPCSDHRLRA